MVLGLTACNKSLSCKRIYRATMGLAVLLITVPATASETTTYGYDALGRLTSSAVSGGLSSGVVTTIQYDAAGNRVTYSVTGSTNPPSETVSAITPASTTAVVNGSHGAALTVNVGGAAPAGTVSFSENGVFLGVAQVSEGQATIELLGLAPGTHTIVATYSGDGTHYGNTVTFTIKVVNLNWLPAVLDLLLD